MVTLLNGTLMSKWYMATLVVMDKSQKDMFHNEVGLCAHYRDTILGLLLHIIGRVYMLVKGERKKKRK